MKKIITKWILRLTLGGLALFVLLLSFLLNPSLLYANKTIVGNCNVYHNLPLDSLLLIRIIDASKIIKSSELFDNKLKYDICLNDGSKYPALVKLILDEPIGTTFYNKIVFLGTINFKDNYGLEGKNKWNITQLIAHSQTHCLQFNKLGLWKSNPIANYPVWKWEGYAEYISRNNTNNTNLIANIEKLMNAENLDNNNWINFSDSTGSTLTFYKRRLLVQFCTEIKKLNFEQLLKDTTSQEMTTLAMINWYTNEMDTVKKKEAVNLR
jgi:hypothetical protein